MLQRRKFLIILALVLVVALLFSLYLIVSRRGERTQAALTELRLTDLPVKVAKEAGMDLTVTAYEGGSIMTNYTGTIHFTSTDPSVTMPADYTYVLGDQGAKTFTLGLYFGSTGTYQIKVEDLTAVISDTQAGIVVFDGHANGSLVKTASAPEVYFIQNGMKSWVITPSVFSSRFSWSQVVIISNTEMSNYVSDSIEPSLHYREGTIFKRADMPEVYVIENKQKRHIDSPDTFFAKGYSWSNIVLAENQSVLDAHTDGADLTGASALPNGALIKTSSAPEVFMLESGSRRHLPSPAVFASQFRWQDVVIISPEAMNLYPIGSDYLFRMGTIIKDYDAGSIYFIEREKKRHFTSPMFYEGLGYSWDDYIVDDSTQILDGYAVGNSMYQLPKYIDVIGDTRSNPTAHQTMVNLMTNDKPYLVFHVGDLVNDGNSAGDWATFDSITGNLRYNTRYYPAIGNHEIASSYYEARFGTDKWYSMNIDNIHFIILDSNTSLASGSTQYNWLHADLDAASSARFTLVFFHHPPYTAGGLADAIALFEAHGVDIVFNGHTHLYARKVAAGIGTYYLITGGGGAPLASCPVAGYTTCTSSYEYVRLLLNNNQLELRAYDSSGTQIDTVDLPGV
ncbi:MAG: putative phosphohydrolase [Candidatus Berkelbacteria bacterium Licking1014_96]|uniref:Putative phosphohydrolase n=1 Tax=Candidatus Berkelbacteria bacterium Licking1014_96 TaxID=2017149 RepID=A0A554LCR3_9BACT|nr:MAG: putative phosphohydrolase [Candidatus Berkelbacteria bacterium Licking1014_96]